MSEIGLGFLVIVVLVLVPVSVGLLVSDVDDDGFWHTWRAGLSMIATLIATVSSLYLLGSMAKWAIGAVR